MKFIDFFAGIGGISLGLERAGHECVGHCEINPYARRVLEKHWPGLPLVGDITEIDASKLPEAELWAGGFPCQDISNAGKQAGIRGSRSGLFFTWMRAVRLVRPQKLLMENVAALLHRGMGEVCGELAESGYDAEWDCLPACAFGAPHRRDRVFIVADAGSSDARCGSELQEGKESIDGQSPQLLSDAGGGSREAEAGDNNGAEIPNAACDRREQGHPNAGGGRKGSSEEQGSRSGCGGTGMANTFGERGRLREAFRQNAEDAGQPSTSAEPGQWESEPNVGRVANGVPSRVDRLRCLGNAVVPQVAEFIGNLLPQNIDNE